MCVSVLEARNTTSEKGASWQIQGKDAKVGAKRAIKADGSNEEETKSGDSVVHHDCRRWPNGAAEFHCALSQWAVLWSSAAHNGAFTLDHDATQLDQFRNAGF